MEKMDSLNLLRFMAPIAAIILLPATLLLEPDACFTAVDLLCTQPAFGIVLAANSSLAYIVNHSNLQVTKCTSALSLQVNMKNNLDRIFLELDSSPEFAPKET